MINFSKFLNVYLKYELKFLGLLKLTRYENFLLSFFILIVIIFVTFKHIFLRRILKILHEIIGSPLITLQEPKNNVHSLN